VDRMNSLFDMAVDAARRGDINLSRRYCELIKLYSQASRVKIPRDIKRWICKGCGAAMIPGLNATVRTRREGKTLRIVTRCMICGYIHRYEFVT